MSEKLRVLIAALGGTISADRDPNGRNVPMRSAEDLISAIPDADEIAEVSTAYVKRVSSRAIKPQDMCVLAREIRAGVYSWKCEK